MQERIPQSIAKRIVFKAFYSADHVTAATGKTIAVVISKNGGAFANPAAGATNATEIGNGWYYVDLAAADTDTLGPLIVRGTAGTIDPAELIVEVVKATNAGFAALPDAAADAAGGLPISDAGSLDLDGLATALATVDGKVVTVDTVVDAIKAKTDNLPAAPAAVGSQMDLVNAPNATAIAALQSGLAKWLDVQGEFSSLSIEIGQLPTAGDVAAEVDSVLTLAHGAGEWRTATGFSTHSAADVWSVETRTITGAVTLANGPHGGPGATLVLSDYSDFQGEGAGLTAEQVWTYATRTVVLADAAHGGEAATITLSDYSGFQGEASSLTAEAIWNHATRTLTSELATAAAPAVVDTVVDAIKARTDTLTAGQVLAVSPVADTGEITLTAGDDYDAAAGTALTLTIAGYAGPNLEGATATLRICEEAAYNAGGAEADLEAMATSAAMDGADAVFTFELTAAQTAALATAPPDATLNHVYQLEVATAAGKVATVSTGSVTVVGRIG